MTFSRRNILKAGLYGMASTLLPSLLLSGSRTVYASQLSPYRAAVCVFLKGGNDGWNTIIPYDESRHHAYTYARQSLALPRHSLLPVNTGQSYGHYGFHPALVNLQSLFNQGRIAALSNVGTLTSPITREQFQRRSVKRPSNLFAHDAQQRQWQSCHNIGVMPGTSGIGGLIAEVIHDANSGANFPSVVSTSGSNLFCLGRTLKPAVINPRNTNTLMTWGTDQNNLNRLQAVKSLLDTDSNHPLINEASHYTKKMFDDIAVYEATIAELSPLHTSFPDTSLGRQLHTAAKLIQARTRTGLQRQIFFTVLNGFDTHSDQLNRHASLLNELDSALHAFYQATNELGIASDVLTFTASDFGRTLMAANGGSDHGWGNMHFVMGGAVNGGRMFGEFPQLLLNGPNDADHKGRMIPTTSVDQYYASIALWMGVPAHNISNLFPNLVNFNNPTLGFV